mmetsp:Transcript_22248/g.64639  ORF Transcript_22248/g.64639 Transcript_22248/m.64639 type:complete len:315 (-) Transcript_22248:1431-2375(-)
MGSRPPIMAMSSRRSLCIITGRPSLTAATAAARAVPRWAKSLPPKAPPTRRTATSTRCRGFPSTRPSICCVNGAPWVPDQTLMRPSSSGTAKAAWVSMKKCFCPSSTTRPSTTLPEDHVVAVEEEDDDRPSQPSPGPVLGRIVGGERGPRTASAFPTVAATPISRTVGVPVTGSRAARRLRSLRGTPAASRSRRAWRNSASSRSSVRASASRQALRRAAARASGVRSRKTRSTALAAARACLSESATTRARGAPTKGTRSPTEKNTRDVFPMYKFLPGTSAAVTTASTPGMVRHTDVSIPSRTQAAVVENTMAP